MRKHRVWFLGWLLWSVASTPASASFHQIKIVEVFPGTTSAPLAQYVMLRMYEVNQNQVLSHRILVYDATGSFVLGNFPFTGNVPNGADNATILIATTQAQSFFSVTADLLMNPVLPLAAGMVCFDAPPNDIDCLTWGSFTGAANPGGAPFNRCDGLRPGRAVKRDISAGGSVLDATDDTDDSAVDFDFAIPAPRANPVGSPVGAAPAATCGSGSVAGLEICDDGGTAPNDGCDEFCRIERPLDFYPLAPCRAVDTRDSGGNPVAANTPRLFRVGGACEIPHGAEALSINATAVPTSTGGIVRLYPADLAAAPNITSVAFNPNQTRAQNSMLRLARDLTGGFIARSSAQTHLVVDVNGYFAQCAPCGNGLGEASEQCDGADLRGNNCSSVGYTGGALDCLDNCGFDTSLCTFCGNGVAEGSEGCDGSDFRGHTCSTLLGGNYMGTLACTTAGNPGGCQIDTSNCTPAGP